MKQQFILLFLLTAQLIRANMASPVWRGTMVSQAFSSHNIEISKEKIHVTIDKDFKTAKYEIEYFIKTDTGGKQIPLLFYAEDFSGDFKIWVDNKTTRLLDISHKYTDLSGMPFEKPESISGEGSGGSASPISKEDKIYKFNDLKYFETVLAKGDHSIRIEYDANVWTNISDWVKEYSFRYSLFPAKYWKTFGTLEIEVNTSNFNPEITTNLGSPVSGSLDSIARWNFTSLPSDSFIITYIPEISLYARTLIVLGPLGLTVIFTFLISVLLVLIIRSYRKKNPAKHISWIVVAGSIVNSFLILVAYIFSFRLIDYVIGTEAGGYHGYVFFVILLYPLLLPVYWFVVLFIDRRVKRKKNNSQ